MVVNTEARIADILLRSLADFSPALPVAWPNRPFRSTIGQMHYRVDVLFATPEQPGVAHGGYKRHSGILQISLYAPRDEGMVVPADELGDVLAHYPRGARFTDDDEGLVVEIGPDAPGLSAPIQEDAWWQQPATIPWFALVTA